MRFKKFLIFLCLLMVIFTIASVNASEVNDTVIASDANHNIIAIDNAQNDDISVSEDENAIADSPKTMTDLKNTIDNDQSNRITLNYDYSYSDDDSSLNTGITISKSVTIDGQNHILNGAGKMRIFQINNYATVTFENIIFLNGWSSNYGGAICNNGENTVTTNNCTFENNQADLGGATYKVSAYNCYFTGNYARTSGGALYCSDASGCTFINNKADYYGGAILGVVSNVMNCTFINNSAWYGGAINDNHCRAENCIFINNTADYGSAISCYSYLSSDGVAKNCTFVNNNVYDTRIEFNVINQTVSLGDTLLFSGLPECGLTVTATKDGVTKTFSCNDKGWNVKYLKTGDYTVKFVINGYDGNSGELNNIQISVVMPDG